MQATTTQLNKFLGLVQYQRVHPRYFVEKCVKDISIVWKGDDNKLCFWNGSHAIPL